MKILLNSINKIIYNPNNNNNFNKKYKMIMKILFNNKHSIYKMIQNYKINKIIHTLVIIISMKNIIIK